MILHGKLLKHKFYFNSDLLYRHNADDFTALDVAVMLNHPHIAHLLMAYGARESPKCKQDGYIHNIYNMCYILPLTVVRNPELRYNHLLHLLTAAEEQINKCRTNLSQSSVNASSQALDVCHISKSYRNIHSVLMYRFKHTSVMWVATVFGQ